MTTDSSAAADLVDGDAYHTLCLLEPKLILLIAMRLKRGDSPQHIADEAKRGGASDLLHSQIWSTGEYMLREGL